MQLVKAVSVFDERSFKVPGPGSYEAKDLRSQQKVSLSGRMADLSSKWIREVPGPGAYKTAELLDKNLKSAVSKFGSCRAGRFSKGEEHGDFERIVRKRNVPGPGECKCVAMQTRRWRPRRWSGSCSTRGGPSASPPGPPSLTGASHPALVPTVISRTSSSDHLIS